ncbi:general stress protein CsbD [Aquimarina sp. RZ0]|uniref:general stress protein CsbD n=1 Tax=Aquimarina sp. RZ0 TaxID=2607730 RepID=UPI0011F35624|nr:general stress protein CsbD [Aquimarina sp. RZ0]KAA1243589.1 general stress protein CsbD [Aquimarina sp. RZ0]
MAKTNITRSWREQKVMLKRRFSFLSDKDFDFEDEQKEMMFDNLAVKLKKTRAELELLFAELQTY